MSLRHASFLVFALLATACSTTVEGSGRAPVDSRVVKSETRVGDAEDRMGRTLVELDRSVDEYVYLHYQPGAEARARKAQVEQYLRTVVAQEGERLIEATADAERPGGRVTATKALAFSRDPAAVSALIRLLDRAAEVRLLASATWSLGQIQSPTTPAEPLLDLVLHPDADVRSNALMALWHSLDARVRSGGSALDPITHSRALTLLQATLSEPDTPAIRAHAAACLGAMGDRRAVAPLAQLLERDSDPFVRTLCAFALAKLGDRSALPALVRMVDRAGEGTPRSAVITAIRAIAEQHGVAAPTGLPDTSRAWGRFVDEKLR